MILFTLLRRIKLNYTPAFVDIVKRVTECVVEASSIFPLKREDEEIKRGAQMRREKRKENLEIRNQCLLKIRVTVMISLVFLHPRFLKVVVLVYTFHVL